MQSLYGGERAIIPIRYSSWWFSYVSFCDSSIVSVLSAKADSGKTNGATSLAGTFFHTCTKTMMQHTGWSWMKMVMRLFETCKIILFFRLWSEAETRESVFNVGPSGEATTHYWAIIWATVTTKFYMYIDLFDRILILERIWDHETSKFNRFCFFKEKSVALILETKPLFKY